VWHRCALVRHWWLDHNGVDNKTPGRLRLVPRGAPWSAEYLTKHGSQERVTERLAVAGCTKTNVPNLAAEAQRLHATAYREDLRARHKRLTRQTENRQ